MNGTPALGLERSSDNLTESTPSSVWTRGLNAYLFIFIAFSLFEWGFGAYNTFVAHASYPLTTPLFSPADRYSDFTNFLVRVSHYHEPGMQTRTDLGLWFPYPLPSIYIFLFFVRLFPDPLTAYLIAAIGIFLGTAVLFIRYLRRHTNARLRVYVAVAITALFGFPTLFLIDRGNIEVFLWLFVVLGAVFFSRKQHYLAAIFFAIAACMKIYPALYLLLFLPRRKFKEAGLGLALIGLFSLGTLKAIGPTIREALRDMAPATNYLNTEQIQALNPHILRYDHSLLALEKQLLYPLMRHRHPFYAVNLPSFERYVHVYSVLAPLSFAILYVWRIRRLPLANQFIAFTLCSLLLPYVSYEYTLVHLYTGFAVFLLFSLCDRSQAERIPTWRIRTAFVLFAVAFSPVVALAFYQYSGQVKCVVLLCLLGWFVTTPIPSRAFDDKAWRPALAAAGD